MANSYEATGKVIAVFDTQQVKDTFKKREFVIEIEDGQYPQQIKFQVTQDKCSTLDSVKVDSTVKVLFNLRGKAFQAKDGSTGYFSNLDAWRVETVTGATTAKPVDNRDNFDDVPF